MLSLNNDSVFKGIIEKSPTNNIYRNVIGETEIAWQIKNDC